MNYTQLTEKNKVEIDILLKQGCNDTIDVKQIYIKKVIQVV